MQNMRKQLLMDVVTGMGKEDLEKVTSCSRNMLNALSKAAVSLPPPESVPDMIGALLGSVMHVAICVYYTYLAMRAAGAVGVPKDVDHLATLLHDVTKTSDKSQNNIRRVAAELTTCVDAIISSRWGEAEFPTEIPEDLLRGLRKFYE
jgi:hypothetical protein